MVERERMGRRPAEGADLLDRDRRPRAAERLDRGRNAYLDGNERSPTVPWDLALDAKEQ
jgi:hypothetical protein